LVVGTAYFPPAGLLPDAAYLLSFGGAAATSAAVTAVTSLLGADDYDFERLGEATEEFGG
jgi:hypothetical protein